jgi:hypothetical protein
MDLQYSGRGASAEEPRLAALPRDAELPHTQLPSGHGARRAFFSLARSLPVHSASAYATRVVVVGAFCVQGTPLQNSIKELWALLHFLEPQKFDDMEEFEAKHSLQNAERISALHEEIRPHMLRRVIKDVERSLPPKSVRRRVGNAAATVS